MPQDNFAAQTYTNPVYPSSFPDPYVLKFCGEYFAYCTGFAANGKVFGILRSRNLVDWTEVGGAMESPVSESPFYWAPEVTYSKGIFYLYYSCGNETLMEIRVAVSHRPDGGFVDCGRRLTSEEFAIDAHIFTDTDGARYMFYATDFLQHTHIGTGTVVDKMVDWFTLEGKPRPVTRARYDWQVYDPARKEKGGARWHTVEGPFVLKRKDKYYEMFSGGNWQNISYGVSFAVTDDITRDEEWPQFSDGEKILPILRTAPGKVIGPGHNSVIRGPNNRELFCVYHRWVDGQRVLAIDRMDFAGRRLFVNGATHTPQIAPFKSAVTGFNDPSFQPKGQWEITDSKAKGSSSAINELTLIETGSCYLVEMCIQNAGNGSGGFYLADNAGKLFELLISRGLAELRFSKGEDRTIVLHGDFILGSVHHLRIELDGHYLNFRVNNTDIQIERMLDRPPTQFALAAGATSTIFSGFSLTRGFEDRFDRPGTAEDQGWQRSLGTGEFHIENGELLIRSSDRTVLKKGPRYENYELAVNLRLKENRQEIDSSYGFVLKGEEDEIFCRIEGDRVTMGDLNVTLPKNYAPEDYHQFRVVQIGGILHLEMEENDLGSIDAPAGPTRIALFCENAAIAVEMARFTNLY